MKKLFFTAFFVFIAFQFSFSQDGINAWTLNGTNMGRIYCGVTNPVTPAIMYVAGLDSGVFKTINGGQNWFTVNNGLTSKRIQCIAIAPSDPNVLYVGTDTLGTVGTNGVYKTTNGGTSWTLMIGGLTELAVQSLVVHPTNPNTAWACIFNAIGPAINGLWKTTNGGTNWFASNAGIASDNKNVLAIAINPLNPNVLYVGTSLVLPGSTGPSKIYKSYDGGANWNLMSTGLPTLTTDNNPVRCLQVLRSDTSVVGAALFVNALTGGFFLSTNGGQSWTRKHDGLPAVAGSLLRSLNMRSANEFYVGMDGGTTTKGVWRTTNGGNNWVDFNNTVMSNTHPVRVLMFKTTGDTTLYAGAAGTTVALTGVYEYSWPAPPTPRVWSEQTSGLATALYSVSAVSDDVAWACGTSGKVLRTTNKGTTWTNVSGNLPATALLYCIFAWDANTAITTASPSGSVMIYKTSNGGANWTTAFSLTAAGAFGDDLWMTSATDAYYIGDPQGGNWHLLKSTNGGNNWGAWSTLATTNTAGTYNNAAWFQGTQVWFPSVGQSHILYSSNMGTNWVTQPITLSEITAICFNSPTTGLAGGSSTSVGLLKTTNSGTNWAAVTAPFATLSISGIAGSGSDYWASLQSTAIHYSSNDGANWSLAYTAPAGSFYHLTKSRTGNTLWGVRANGAITRYGAPITGVTPISTTVPTDYSVSQNYPNPFNPSTKINFALPKSGLVTLKIYDVLGREVATLINEIKNAGSYSVDFNASALSSGMYFYRLESNGFKDAKKMMLVR